MFDWISQFFKSLPEWYWVLPYAWCTYMGLRLWTGEQSGRIQMDSQDQGMPTIGGIVLNLVTLIGSLMTLLMTTADRPFADYSHWTGFKMMGVGLAAFAVREAGSFVWRRAPAWGKASKAWMAEQDRLEAARRKAEEERRNRDPEHIMGICRVRFDQAKRERNRIDDVLSGPDATEIVGFDQAGENLLGILKKLLKLVARIDAWFVAFADTDAERARADSIYPDVPLDQFVPLLGTGTVDAASLGKLRECAQGEIESLVLFFQRLPAAVLQENVYREAKGIEGLQKEMDEIAPLLEATSSTGIIADLETGRIQERLLERLAQSAAGAPVPTAPHGKPASADAIARAKVRA